MKIFFVLLIALTSTNLIAADITADSIRIGATLGNVGMLEDVGDDAGNAIGFGAIGGYSISDEFHLEFTYLQSSHDDLDHQEFSAGIMNYFETYETMYFHGVAGIGFATNELDLTTEKLKDSAFGLYLGAGADVLTKRNLVFGLQGRYYKMFDADKQNSSGTTINVVQDFFTVLFRIMYTFR